MAMKVNPPKIVLLNWEGTFSYKADPRNEAIVGKSKAPQNILVGLIGSDVGGNVVSKDCRSGV